MVNGARPNVPQVYVGFAHHPGKLSVREVSKRLPGDGTASAITLDRCVRRPTIGGSTDPNPALVPILTFPAVWNALKRWISLRRAPQRKPAPLELPSWARAGRRRRAHIRRVAALIEEWAGKMDISEPERGRWLKAVWLHDALRDARLPEGTAHGAAAADRAARDGEADPGVLDAVRYHSVGYAGWDDVGRMLYLADFLEPGRRGRRKERARLAKGVPRNRDGILRQIVAVQVRARLRTHRPIDPLTLEFWNSLTAR
jgi:HD superfamily phosphohydrolase YqeK